MSKRRRKGEIVARRPGSGFVASAEPRIVKIIGGRDFCMLGCGDSDCCEWDVEAPNGGVLYHVSECQMGDSIEEKFLECVDSCEKHHELIALANQGFVEECPRETHWEFVHEDFPGETVRWYHSGRIVVMSRDGIRECRRE